MKPIKQANKTQKWVIITWLLASFYGGNNSTDIALRGELNPSIKSLFIVTVVFTVIWLILLGIPALIIYRLKATKSEKK